MDAPRLSQVPFDDLKVGDVVQSTLTGNKGLIEKLIPKPKARRAEDNQIVVRWSTGSFSDAWQHKYGAVLYLGAEMKEQEQETVEELQARLQRFSASKRGQLRELIDSGYTEPDVPDGVYLGPTPNSRKTQ